MKLFITISPKKILRVLIVISVVLVFFSLLGDLAFNIYSRHFGLDIFNVDNNISISTWYSSSLLLICALLLVNISYSQTIGKGNYKLYWKILTIIFFALSITKATSFHKHVFRLTSSMLDRMGISVPSFIIGLVLILIFFLFYLRFFMKLQKKVQRLIFIAVMVYVAGSITMELVGGLYSHLYRRHTPIYSLLSGFEELFEMIGSVIFLYALLSYIEMNRDDHSC